MVGYLPGSLWINEFIVIVCSAQPFILSSFLRGVGLGSKMYLLINVPLSLMSLSYEEVLCRPSKFS